MYDYGDFDSLQSIDAFLQRMKEISVKTIHKTIHMLNMWNLVQMSDENIKAFLARIISIADLCDMFVTCVAENCDTKTSFRDQVVQQVLLKGMINQDIRQRVLIRTKNGEL